MIVFLLLVSIANTLWGNFIQSRVIRRSIELHDERVKTDVVGGIGKLSGELVVLKARVESLEARTQ